MVTLREFHGFGDRPKLRWRVDSQGLEIEGEGYQRTPGEPKTIARIWREWGDHVQTWAYTYSVPVELLLMTCATEGGMYLDNPKQDHKEPNYISDDATPWKVSIGLCHILLSTAREVMRWPGMSRAWLAVPENNFMVAAAVIRRDARVTGFDPVLTSAKYNAGSLKPSQSNRFGLVAHRDHLDRATKWFGDAATVIASKGGAERDWVWALKALEQGTLL